MENFYKLLRDSGGWFQGHTIFKNGYHGDGWIEKGFIIRNPRILDLVTGWQAEQISKNFPEADLMIGPVVNGSVLASFVAKHLGCEFEITVGKNEDIEFHRMNVPEPLRKVVLVEDLIFTGNDVRSNIKFLKNFGLEVLGISVWINRQSEKIENTKIISLLEKSPFEFYKPKDCPLCRQNEKVAFVNIRE